MMILNNRDDYNNGEKKTMYHYRHRIDEESVKFIIVEDNDELIDRNKPIEDEDDDLIADQSRTATNTTTRFKLLLMVALVIQYASVVLVGRHTRSSVPESELFNVTHVVMVTEIAKFCTSLLLESITTRGALWASIKANIIENPMDSLKISIPALLYLVQNTLFYVALTNLSVVLVQVCYQAKLVVTAFVSVIILRRRYNVVQWVCLFALSAGVVIVVLGETGVVEDDVLVEEDGGQEDYEDDLMAGGDMMMMEEEGEEMTGVILVVTDSIKASSSSPLMTGLISIAVSCFCSAFSGVYFEMVLKNEDFGVLKNNKKVVSLWMRNIQLSFFSILVTMCQYYFFEGTHKDINKDINNDPSQSLSFYHGFTGWVWLLVCLQAFGGLLLAAVMKYADNVWKGLAAGVSIVVASVCSSVLFGTALTSEFMVGAVLILGAVVVFHRHL